MPEFQGEELPVDCPFCGGGLAVGKNPDSIMHTMPFCKEFDQLEALDFVTAVRRKLQGDA